MDQPVIAARILNPGTAEGPVLVLTEPLSFWGGFDPATGRIVDAHHPERGAPLTGTILLMRESRGSGTAPGAIAEAIRRNTAPAAIILVEPDINLAVGAAVAAELYGTHCPVLQVSSEDFAGLTACTYLCIADNGIVSSHS